MKRNTTSAFVLVLTLLLVLTGCGSTSKTSTEPSKSPEATAKATEAAASPASSPKESAEAVAGASKASYTPIDQLKDSYDIIILGAGGAGMTAALEAKAKGLNPVIFEKMPVAGGNTTKSSSGMNASETKFQKEQGIQDSNELFYNETLKGGHDTNDKEMLRFFVDNSASAIDWLDSIGIRLNNLTITGGMSEKRTHRPEDGSAIGQYLVTGLVKNVQEKGIPLFVNSNVTEITGKDGKVNGVKVTINGTDEKEITAKAVVVTTGGFGSNQEMIEAVRPDLKGFAEKGEFSSPRKASDSRMSLTPATTSPQPSTSSRRNLPSSSLMPA